MLINSMVYARKYIIDVINYDFEPLRGGVVKPEVSFINAYVNKCLESEGSIISTRIMYRIIDAKYKRLT